MRITKIVFLLLAVALLGGIVSPTVRADDWDKKTSVTFSQAVEVPGQILPAGTYIFKLMNSDADRHVVQIFNADGSQIITTILAINNYRLNPTGESVMKFNERSGDSPEALRAWFYSGDNYGQEFVYPKARAIQLAQTTKVVVPAVEADTLDSSAMKTVPIVAITPDQKEVELSTAIETAPVSTTAKTPAPVEVAQSMAAKQLPKTASYVPLVALFGVALIGFASGLKRFSSKLSM